MRSTVDRWVDWSATTLQPDFLMGIFWGFYRTPEPQRNMPAVTGAISRVARHMQLLDRHLASQSYMAGRTLSLADIAVGTNLYRYLNIEIDRPDVPNVLRWYETLASRPAYQTHVMIPFAELYGRLAY